MPAMIILQAEAGNSGDQVLIGLLILFLLIFPVLFVRALLKDWKPASGAGFFWKVLIIFSSPIYIGVIVLKLLEVSGFVTPEFAHLFPSFQAPTGNLPDVSRVPEGTVNFWSDFTIGILVSFLVAAIVAVFVYLLFGGERPSKRAGNVLFWIVMYFSALLIANSTFDKIQEVSLEGSSSSIQKNRQVNVQKQPAKRPSFGIFGSLVFGGDDDDKASGDDSTAAALRAFDQLFRTQKKKAEEKMGDLAKTAPDSVISSFLKYTNAQIEYLAQSDPSACHYFFQTGSYLRGFSARFLDSAKDPKVSTALADFEKEVRSPSTSDITPPMDDQNFDATTQKIEENLKEKVAPEDLNLDVLSNPQKLTSPALKRQGCITYLAYASEVAHLPKDEALAYYRALLAKRAAAVGAEGTLREIPELSKLYDTVAWQGSPLDVLFDDNPNLKRNFVGYMYETYYIDKPGLDQKIAVRKQELIDANAKYYYERATADAIHDHLSFHLSMLQNLKNADPVECGNWAGILEVFNPMASSATVERSHGNSLAGVMKSAWYNQTPEPRKLARRDMYTMLDRVVAAAERTAGVSIDLDVLYDPGTLSGAGEKRQACESAIAFYRQLLKYSPADVAAFYRAFMAYES